MDIKAYQKLYESIEENYKSIYAHGIIEQATGHFVSKISDELK